MVLVRGTYLEFRELLTRNLQRKSARLFGAILRAMEYVALLELEVMHVML
jgi:hypothetical protein